MENNEYILIWLDNYSEDRKQTFTNSESLVDKVKELSEQGIDFDEVSAYKKIKISRSIDIELGN